MGLKVGAGKAGQGDPWARVGSFTDLVSHILKATSVSAQDRMATTENSGRAEEEIAPFCTLSGSKGL